MWSCPMACRRPLKPGRPTGTGAAGTPRAALLPPPPPTPPPPTTAPPTAPAHARAARASTARHQDRPGSTVPRLVVAAPIPLDPHGWDADRPPARIGGQPSVLRRRPAP